MASTTLSPPDTKAAGGGNGPGRPNDNDWNGPPGGGGDSWDSEWARRSARADRTGMWVALAPIVMLFAALTSALVVRKGLSGEWQSMAMPRVLWINTALLLGSSLTLARSKKMFSLDRKRSFSVWWHGTAILGTAFIVGQCLAWRELSSRGIYLASNPNSSFFYLLTATHGLHLLGGICALFYVAIQARRNHLSQTAVDVTTIYWHFMDGLWIYLLLLMLTGGWY